MGAGVLFDEEIEAIEQLLADASLLFNERSLPTALVPNRTVGAQLGGSSEGMEASSAAGPGEGGTDRAG